MLIPECGVLLYDFTYLSCSHNISQQRKLAKVVVFAPFYKLEAKVLPNVGFILWRRYVLSHVSHISFCLPQPLWLPLLQECHCAEQKSGCYATFTGVDVWKSYHIHNVMWFIVFIKTYITRWKSYIGQWSISIYDHIDIFSHPYLEGQNFEWGVFSPLFHAGLELLATGTKALTTFSSCADMVRQYDSPNQ